MSKNLLNLSGKIDSLRLEAFEAIATVAESEGVRFFVIGAAARDMIRVSRGYSGDFEDMLHLLEELKRSFIEGLPE